MRWMIFLLAFMHSEGKSICLPDQTNGSCQWNLFGWETYHGCGYKQKINGHSCIIKNLDGSKSTFLTEMNISSKHQYCLEFKYLITRSVMDTCWNFYGKTRSNVSDQSRLFSTFCIPKKQAELHWYSLNVSLPENLTMINVVTESYPIAGNHSLIIKDLSVQQCDQIAIALNILLINSTINSLFLDKRQPFWIRYQRVLITSILICSFLLLIIVAIRLYINHRQPTRTERIHISPVTLSQHFYEEPISVIFQPPIEISVYDHVRDNYV